MKPWKGLLLILLLAGCATRPDQQIYVLGGAADPTAGVRDNNGRQVIEIKSVLIPEYLDNTDLMLRSGAHELKPSLTGMWGERLSIGFTQALTGALAKRVSTATVLSRPPAGRPDIQILVDVTGLQAVAGGDTVLTAHWTILRLTGSAAPRSVASAQGNFIASGDGFGDKATVAAISNTIDQLADRIAIDLR